MRMQGVTYREIENWLAKQGAEERLGASTIFKNLKSAKMAVSLPYAEELAERWGGGIYLDVVRELAGQILAQRNRVDALERHEKETQRRNPNFFDRRIKGERETLAALLKDYSVLTLKNPMEAAKERAAADKAAKEGKELKITDDAAQLITNLILDGELGLMENEAQDG